MLRGGRARTDRAGAGTPAKLLEMWVTYAGGHVGDPKTNSRRGKSARSRYQKKKPNIARGATDRTYYAHSPNLLCLAGGVGMD